MQNLVELQNNWTDTPEFHNAVKEQFDSLVNNSPKLKAYRDFVEGANDTPQKIFGFGERSFLWMWWLIIQEMPQTFSFMEIGVFRGQILGLIRLIADMQGKTVIRYGVTPLDTSGDNWESDYAADIALLHDHFGIEKDYNILHGSSMLPSIIVEAQKLKVDILYIDGDHTYDAVISDMKHYMPILNANGFLVLDDACADMRMPYGFFQGIAACTAATLEIMVPLVDSGDYKFVGNVVHNRIYQKL